MSKEILLGVKFVQEQKLVGKFFEEIAMESGKVVYGIKESMKMLESGALQDILIAENFTWLRVECLDSKKEKHIEFV